jgi:hypothetical protein
MKVAMSQQQFYSDEEAQRLLRLAAQNTPTTGMTREELIRAAGELGIPEERFMEAEAQVAAERAAVAQAEENKTLRKQFNREFNRKQWNQVMGLISGNALFIFIWFVSGMGYFWPIWIMGWWGIGVVVNFANAFLNPEYRERAFERWLSKRNGLPPTEGQENEHEEDDNANVCKWDYRVHRHRHKRRWRDWS